MANTDWWKRFLQRRHTRNYRHKIMGATRPETHFRRPSRGQILAAAKRFVKDGETRNAVEMIKLAYHPKQLNLQLINRGQRRA